ncbi:MAG: TonB-dependent receptor [Terriglobia bacterium]
MSTLHGFGAVGSGGFFAAALGLTLTMGAAAQTAPQNLTGRSLEDLMNVEVTSVSKKEQTLSKTPAAVYVIGQDDIKRSGATNVPDLLRMAPGVEVAQIASNQWAISVRGFNAIYSNKVLVLVDGRAVYVTSFSGVFWDAMDIPLEDIDRIEVIRGPGGTVWGANAVNGVISIITKNAADTKGALVTATAGAQGVNEELLQYGGHAGSRGAYRAFAKYASMDSARFPNGEDGADGWRKVHAGFRADWRLSAENSVSVQGGLVNVDGGATRNVIFPGTQPFQTAINTLLKDLSGDVLARWDRTLRNGSTSLQLYDSATRRHDAGSLLDTNVTDIDFSHHLTGWMRHDIVWGLDFRITHDNILPESAYSVRFTVPSRTVKLFSTFAQDEIRLSKSLSLTVGSKIEHNDFTGVEIEPSAQLIWARNDRRSLWFSAAKAIRQPDRSDYSIQYDLAVVPVPGVGNGVVRVLGNPQFRAERVRDFEAGYRTQAGRRISLDFTAFLQLYRSLESNEQGLPYVATENGAPLLILPVLFGNKAQATNYGFEAFGTWNVTRAWKINAGYSSLRMKVTVDPASTDTVTPRESGNSPSQQIQMRSSLTLRKNVECDGSFKYVTALNTLGVPGYGRLDSRVAWHPLEAMELSLTGQNLNSHSHVEFLDNSGLSLRTVVARSVIAKISLRF